MRHFHAHLIVSREFFYALTPITVSVLIICDIGQALRCPWVVEDVAVVGPITDIRRIVVVVTLRSIVF